MNKRYIILFLLLIVSFSQVEATHLFGGEVTWKCLGSGQFQFTVKVYRDCNGVTFTAPGGLNVYGHPSVTNIPFNPALTVINDLSPPGCGFSCVSPQPGAVQEFILKTNPISLNGTPPATGWTFAIDDCCRNTLQNLNGGGQGFTLRATMYPYFGLNTNPCYDSSPIFTEKPNTFICIGYPYTYNPTAVDDDRDSLVYSWANCLDNPTSSPGTPFNANIINFGPAPYTVNNQLPGNVTLNSQSGEVSFFVPQSAAVVGNFATCIKVTAYRCGQKIAEIFRDYGVTLRAGCLVQGVAPNNINLPPTLSLPFANGTAKDTTVYVGDTVRFNINATDFQRNLGAGAVFQNISIYAYGDQFGNPINTASGCNNPPCAKLDKLLPAVSPIANFINFEWVTACNHIVPPAGCLSANKTYYFIVKAQDDYCFPPAISTITISITIKIPPKLTAPAVRGASVLNNAGDVGLYWESPGPPSAIDTHNVFHSYEIYASNAFGGPYTLVDSVTGNKKFFKQKGDTITATQLSTLIGANANAAPVYFYVKTRSICDGDSISLPSDTIRTIFVNNIATANCETQLTWNSLFLHAYPGSASNTYTIYREYPIGAVPVSIGTAPATWPTASYTDPFSRTICLDSVKYYVSINDTLIIVPTPAVIRCVSKSNKTKRTVDNRFTANISPAGPSNICPTQCVNLTASPSPLSPCFTYSYAWSNGGNTATISACNAGGYSAVITASPSGCTSTTPVSVVNALPFPTANISGNANVCPADSINLTFNFTGTPPWNYSYNVPGPGCVGSVVVNGVANTTPLVIRIPANCNFNYTLNSVTAGCPGNVAGSANITLKTVPTATLSNTTNDTICAGASSTLTLAWTGTGPWNYVIKSTTGPDITGVTAVNPLVLNVSPASTTTYTLFSVQDACKGTISGVATRRIVVNPLGTATLSIVGNSTICNGSGTSIKIDFTGGSFAPYVCGLKDNTTGIITPINTNLNSITIPVSPASTTTYSVVNFTTSTKNCIGTIANTVVVTVKPLPTADIFNTTNSTICRNDSIRMQVNFTGTGPYVFGLVTNSGGAVNINAAASPYFFYVYPTNNTNYIVTTVNDAFCAKTGINDTVKTIVNQRPTAVLSGTNSICAGQPSTLTINFTGVGPFSGSYSANPGGVTNYNVAVSPYTASVNPASTTIYSLGATVNDANCPNATNPATATVTVNALPTASINGNKTICQGQNDTLLVSFATGAAPWRFYYKDGLGNTFGPIVTANNPYKLVVSPSATTTFQLDSVFSGTCKGAVNGIGNVTVRPLPSAVIATANDTICNGGATSISIQFTGTAPFSYQLAGQALQVAATNPVAIPVNPTTTTTYTLQVVNDQICTRNTNQPVTVRVIPLPTAIVSTTTPRICIGSSGSITVNFTGQGPFSTTYSNGSVNAPVNAPGNSITIPVSPTAPTTYSLNGVVTGLFGCSSPVNVATASIQVDQLPVMTMSGNPSICDGGSTIITLNFVGTAPFNYTYFNGVSNVNGVANTTPAQLSVSPTTTTTYLPIAVTDQYCAGTSLNGSALVTVHPIPTVSIMGSDTICLGGSSTLNLHFTGTPPFTYSYTSNSVSSGPLVSNIDSVIIPVTPLISTTYALGVTLDDRFCTNTAVSGLAYLKVTPTPTANISGTTAICAGQSTSLQIAFTGEAPYTYSYNAGASVVGPLTTNSSSVSINVSPLSTTNYSLPVSITGNGCTGTTSGNALVTVNPLPQAVITTLKDTLCKGDSTQLRIQFTGTSPFTYQLQGQGVQNAGSNPYLFYVAPTANTTYTLANVSDANCAAPVNQAVNIKVLNNPTVAISTATPSLCNGTSGSITLNFTGNAPFSATYSNGSTNFPVNSSSNSIVIPVTPTQNTTYSLTGNVVALYGCKTTATGSTAIVVHDLPQAVISGSPAICLNQQTSITINFTGTPPFSYTYLNNVTNQSVSGSTSLNPLPLTVNPTVSTSYSVTAVQDNFCVGTQTTGLAQVTVNPLPVPVITGVASVCDGQTSVLSTTIPYAGYQWSTNASGSTITVSQTGNYTVSVTDANGCKNSSPSFTFTAHPVPVAEFTNDTSKTCEIPKINFTNLSTYQIGATFQWQLGENTASNEINPSHIYTAPGTFNISLIVTNPFGCADTVDRDVDIRFYPLPVAAFKANPEVTNIFSGPINFIDESQYAVSWKWIFAEGDTSNEQNVAHYFPEIGEYMVKLIVKNVSGCVSETLQQVVVNPFYLPSAFTPNGDGRNEVFFEPGFAMDYSGFNLRIFNRWGQLFYQTNTYTNPWDGSDGKGSPAAQGVYVYSLSITGKNGKQHKYNGTITLLR